MLKSSKGITLVALVITIIVLLILAGVTLSIALNGGIINQSQEAVNSWQNASANESSQFDYLNAVFYNFIQNTKAASPASGS